MLRIMLTTQGKVETNLIGLASSIELSATLKYDNYLNALRGIEQAVHKLFYGEVVHAPDSLHDSRSPASGEVNVVKAADNPGC